MCDYCGYEVIIFEVERPCDSALIFAKPGDKIPYENFYNEYEHLFIDNRGYLRFVDKLDSGCLDHGHKIKIKYCPFCGKEFKE